MKRIWTIVIYLLYAAPLAHATSIGLFSNQCPVCGESFVSTSIGSFYKMRARYYDTNLSLMMHYGQIKTCPHCLYSSLDNFFSNLTPSEAESMREITRNLKFPTEYDKQNILRGWNFQFLVIMSDDLSFRILANEFDKGRTLDDLHWLYNELYPYYESTRSKDGVENLSLLVENRRRAITAISTILEKPHSTLDTEKSVIFTYLLGELHRREGATEKALQYFHEVKERKHLLDNTTTGNSNKPHWVVRFAEGQALTTLLMNKSNDELADILSSDRGSNETVRLKHRMAVRVLRERNTDEAWTVLGQFLSKSPLNLLIANEDGYLGYEDFKRHLPLLNWVSNICFNGFASQQVEDKEAYSTITRKFKTRVTSDDDNALTNDKAAELLSYITNSTITAERPVPDEWDYHELLDCLAMLITNGCPEAVGFLHSLCEAADEDLINCHFTLFECLKAVIEQPGASERFVTSVSVPNYYARLIFKCTDYMRGNDAWRPALLNVIEGPSLDYAWCGRKALVRDCALYRNDPFLKAALLKQVSEGWLSLRCCYEYLWEFCDADDVELLVGGMKRWQIHEFADWHRYYIERFIIGLKLKGLISDAHPDATPKRSLNAHE